MKFEIFLLLTIIVLSGLVHFDNSIYRINISTNLQPNEEVYDFSQHIVFNDSAFQNVYVEFDFVYDPHFSIEASTGVLYTQRTLPPKVFYLQIEIEYDVTLADGTVVSDGDHVNALITAIGENISNCNAITALKYYTLTLC